MILTPFISPSFRRKKIKTWMEIKNENKMIYRTKFITFYCINIRVRTKSRTCLIGESFICITHLHNLCIRKSTFKKNLFRNKAKWKRVIQKISKKKKNKIILGISNIKNICAIPAIYILCILGISLKNQGSLETQLECAT